VKGFHALYDAFKPFIKAAEDGAKDIAKSGNGKTAMAAFKEAARNNKLKTALMSLSVGFKGYSSTVKDWNNASYVDIIREATGWMSIVPGVIASPLLATQGIDISPQAWDMFSDTMGVISVFSWEVYEGQ
jgi:hypothetical protein